MGLFNRRRVISQTPTARPSRTRQELQIALRAAVGAVVESLENRTLFAGGECPNYPAPLNTPPLCKTCKIIGESPNAADAYQPGQDSLAPVSYFGGVPQVDSVDLGSNGFGLAWGISRSWSGLDNTGPLGNGWSVKQLPQLMVYSTYAGAGATPRMIAMIDGGGGASLFEDTVSPTDTYTPRFYLKDKLTYTAGTGGGPGEFQYTDTNGDVTKFYDVPRSGGYITDTQGQGYALQVNTLGGVTYRYGAFKSFTDVAGNTITSTYDSSGNLQYLTRSDSVSGESEREYFTYTNLSNSSSLATATVATEIDLQRSTDGGSTWTTVRKVLYDYYTGETSPGVADVNGRLGDLRLVTIEDGSGAALDHKYYRYYTVEGGYMSSPNYASPSSDAPSDAGSYSFDPRFGSTGNTLLSCVKDVFEGNAYVRLSANVSNYQTASESSIDPYATYVFDYQRWSDDTSSMDPWDATGYTFEGGYHTYSRYRVISEIAQGKGCSCAGDNGQGTYGFEYHTNPNSLTSAFGNYSTEYNVWRMKTIESLPDGNQNLVYTNEVGQVMLSVYQQLATPVSVSAWTHSGTVVTVTASGLSVSVGDTIRIRGAISSGDGQFYNTYNGVFKVQSVSGSTFTYYVPQDPDTVTAAVSFTSATVSKVVQQEATFYEYDGSGRMILKAEPSAVSGYDDTYDDLLNNVSGNYQYLRDNAGLIEVTDYYGSTTASATNAGGIAGYFMDTKLAHGESDIPTATPIETRDYFSHTNAASVAISLVADDTLYGATSSGDPRTTQYQYAFVGDGTSGVTNQMISCTTILPPIVAIQNGPASTTSDTAHADTSTDYYDKYGNVIFSKDAAGYVTFNEYDVATGSIKKTIVDADTSITADFDGTSVPTGLTSPAGTRLRLTTASTIAPLIDAAGRPNKVTGANGNVTWMTYSDANHETRVYPGWHLSGTNYVTTGPVTIMREVRPTSGTNLVYLDTMTVTMAPEASSTPTGTESPTAIMSISRSYMNNGDQVVETDQYFNVSGASYPVAYHYGTSSNNSASGNYHATFFHYDERGRRDSIVAPTGTITRMVYDGQGRLTSTWVGTDDGTSGVGDFNPNSPHNMVDIQDNYFDTYDPSTLGTGDGNLTRTVTHPNGSNSVRVTDNFYDWRDRLVATKSGVLLDSNNRFASTSSETNSANVIHRPITVYTYDNLDEVVQRDRYDGDGVGLTNGAGVSIETNPTDLTVAGPPSQTYLRARATISFDDQGRPYRTDQYDVQQYGTNAGTYATNTLTSYTWYDHRGNVMTNQSPGGLTTKIAYDGADRQIIEYATDGGQTNAGAGTVQSWSNAASVSNDIVLSQIEAQYDGSSNVIELTTRQRFHNDATNGAGLGSLRDPANDPKARASYQVFYYDTADRKTASVDVGTYGGTNGAYTRPSTPEARSGTALVTTFGYSSDAVQTIAIAGSPTGGTFTLTFNGQTTGSIAYNATANGTGSVQSALAALSGIGTGNVAVMGSGGVFSVRFMGSLAGTAEPLITATSSLTGGTSPSVSVVNASIGDDNGRLQQTTDPKGIVAKTDYDMLGRTLRTVSAFSTGLPTSSTDQTTEYTLDGDNHVLTMKAWVNNSGTNNVFQTTKYVYSVTTSTGSINSNDLLLQVQYPNTSTGNPGTTSAYIESYTYDALGEQTKKTQRTGSVHQYTYDPLGRMTSDNVITLGGGVNGSIRRLDYAFDTGGRLYTATSYAGTTTATIVNQVQRLYNGLGQMTQEYQSHSGAVITSGTSATPSVQYTYNEMSGGANNSRLTGIVYPTGSRTVTYDYSGHTGLDNVISRLSKLTQTLGSGTNAVTTTLETYDFLGMNTVVRVGHPQTGVDLTYIQQSGDTNAVSDAGDIYTGLDRFGRVSDQNYLNTNSGTSLTSTDRFQFGYDQNSNVMYKNNLVSSSNSELYHANGTNAGYDSLNRLTNFQRGTLASGNTSISGSPSATRNWTLDAQGNWSANADGNSYTVNAQNQYATVTSGGCCCCSSSGTTLSFGYDNDGNLTSRPTFWCNVPSHADTFTYDAWDREANFTHTESSSVQTVTEQTFNIDALGRRVQVVVTDTGWLAGTVPTDDLYYSTAGQVLEDDNVHTAGGGYNQMQLVWSPTYINDLVLRDHSTAGNGTFDERIYVQHDANHNVTAITNASSGTSLAVLERFQYDPYGAPTVLTSGWASSNDTYNWQYMFQGGRYDQYSGLYSFQAREYDSTLGRWIQQDSGGGYVDGASLYQFVRSNPPRLRDPSGRLADGAIYWLGLTDDEGGTLPYENGWYPSWEQFQRQFWIAANTYAPRPEPAPAPAPTTSRVKICKGYLKGDLIYDTIPAHYFLLVDGVGYGKYANSHAGGPPDASGGIGVISTKGTVQEGDEEKYPITDNPAGVPDGMTYAIAEDPTVPIDADKLLALIRKDLHRRDLKYGVRTNDCQDWVNDMLVDSQDWSKISWWEVLLLRSYSPTIDHMGNHFEPPK